MAEDHKIHDGKKETKHEDTKSAEAPKTELKKTEEKKVESKKAEVKKDNKPKKNEAIVNGRDQSISIKHAVSICNMIRGKNIDVAIKLVEEVTKYKRAVPMRGEIPHRKGKMMSGRYPIKGSGIILILLKSLKSNAIFLELELEKYVLFCVPNVAPRPFRRFGKGRFKRCHVTLKLIPIVKNKKEKKTIK